MKRYITKVLKSVAGFFLAFPIAYIVVIATLFNIPLNTCVGILLSPFYYIVAISVVIAGYGLWEMRRWSWYLVIISQILVTYENALLIHGYSESHHKAVAFLMSVFLQVLLVYRVAKEIRVPYFFPRIRWWESNPRYRLSIPVTLQRRTSETVEAEILDLSITGCFIKFRHPLVDDELLTLKFKIFEHQLECQGTVVWLAQSAVTHPRGVGIKFDSLNRQQKRSLRLSSKKLKKISSFYRRFRYLISPEEFLKRLEEIETSSGRVQTPNPKG